MRVFPQVDDFDAVFMGISGPPALPNRLCIAESIAESHTIYCGVPASISAPARYNDSTK